MELIGLFVVKPKLSLKQNNAFKTKSRQMYYVPMKQQNVSDVICSSNMSHNIMIYYFVFAPSIQALTAEVVKTVRDIIALNPLYR